MEGVGTSRRAPRLPALRLLGALVAMLAVSGLAACAPARGAVREVAAGPPIPVAAVLDLHGPSSAAAASYAEGMRDYVAWRNAHGGASGRLIEMRMHDADGEDRVADAVADGALAVLGWGLGQTTAASQLASAGDVAFLPASAEESLALPAEHPSSFVVGPTSATQLRAALSWIARDAGGHADVLFLHADSDFGRSPVEAARQFIARQGLDIGFQARPDSADPALQEGAQGGRSYLVVHDLPEVAARIIAAARPPNVKVVCLGWCADERLVALAGEAAEGVVGVQPVAPIAANAPGQHEPARFLAAQGMRLEDHDLHYLQGWYGTHVVAEALARVVEMRGEMDAGAVRRALEGRVGPALGPLRTGVGAANTFTSARHEGSDSVRIYQVRAGAWHQIGEYPPPKPASTPS